MNDAGGGGRFDFMSTHPANRKRIKVSLLERRNCGPGDSGAALWSVP